MIKGRYINMGVAHYCINAQDMHGTKLYTDFQIVIRSLPHTDFSCWYGYTTKIINTLLAIFYTISDLQNKFAIS